jgi:hypothetical protein
MAVGFLFALFLCVSAGHSQSVFYTHSVFLKGQSKGGAMTFTKASGGTTPYVTVTNAPGDPARLALGRIALELERSSGFKQVFSGGSPVSAFGDENIDLFGDSAWVFGGDETGFGIPPPPLDVSVTYHSSTPRFVLRWVSPAVGYDAVSISWRGYLHATVPGTGTHFVHFWGGIWDSGFLSTTWGSWCRA